MISVSVWGVFFFSLRFHMWVRLCNIYLCLISLSIMSLLLSKIARSKVFFTWGNDLKKNTVRPSLVHLCMLSHFSRVRLCTIPWTVAHQAPLSMGVSDKHTGVGCHTLLQGTSPTQGSNPCLLRLLYWQAGSLLLVPSGKPKPRKGW